MIDPSREEPGHSPVESVEVVSELVRRIFPDLGSAIVERVREGFSTRVYRIGRPGGALYLRVLPEAGASFAPEVLVHQLLLVRHVSVPEVVYFEHLNPALGRSVMVTTEIRGSPLGHGATTPHGRDILVRAGRDLATLNGVPVRGFGWIRRDAAVADRLEAECATYQEWIHQDLDDCLAALVGAGHLRARDAQAIREIVARQAGLFAAEQACLAHGDFDATHVFHDRGEYTGIIDFGEIRGTNALYDLGHFQVEGPAWLPYLIEGYAERARLPADYLLQIQASSLLVATRRLGLGVIRRRPFHAPDLEAIRRALGALA